MSVESSAPRSVNTPDLGWSLSPLDGRYRKETVGLTAYLSEEALNQARIHVEIEWLVFISKNHLIPGLVPLSGDEVAFLRALPTQFEGERRIRLSELEAETRHDVKAVEYLIREYLEEFPEPETPTKEESGSRSPLTRYSQAVHFLCTSEDINNLAYALSVKAAVTEVWLPSALELVGLLRHLADELADVPMLARTHGQSATPTTMGKELAVFAWRLNRQVARIQKADYLGKFNGATGTFSAHHVVLPNLEWAKLSQSFVEGLGLEWNPLTTQIEPHDWQGELYSAIQQFNRIAHNLATDMWSYISLGYFHQELAAQGSTGSSTMPHKVNPIRFENAEANLELSDALFGVISSTLSTSRMQRDLSDSSMQRNIGSAFGYSLVALSNLKRGLQGVKANGPLMGQELDNHWEVLSEAIQQALRLNELDSGGSTKSPEGTEGSESSAGPYEALKAATRGKTVTQNDLLAVISSASLPKELAERLSRLTPRDYTGRAAELAQFWDSPSSSSGS